MADDEENGFPEKQSLRDLDAEDEDIPDVASEMEITDTALAVLEHYTRYEFNVWDLNEKTGGQALRALVMHTVEDRGLLDEIGIPRMQFENFVFVVQETYNMPTSVKEGRKPFKAGLDGEDSALVGPVESMLNVPRFNNPYHNAVHAADVVQTAMFMIFKGNLHTVASLSVIELFSMVIAGTIHDYAHPGFNNMYCVKTQHPLAFRYNDKAILEMHHVASAYALMHSSTAFRFFNEVTESQYIAIREVVMSTVLATDMSSHFAELGKFKSRIQAGDFLARAEGQDAPPHEDKLLACNVVIHACDISNPAKPLDVYVDWTTRVLWEFFKQGDLEKSAGVAVSMFMDRDTTNIAKCQLGFIDILVFPLFDALTIMLPEMTRCCEALESNKAYWKTRVEEMEEELQSGLQRMPAPQGGIVELLHDAEKNEFSTRVVPREDGQPKSPAPNTGSPALAPK